jgi:adenine-specific DNA methylase
MRQSLKNEYECFKPLSTPRAESIVSNPAEGKDADVFEEELNQAFTNIRNQLKDDGLLIFTYHHSDSESWGELLTALCDVNFQITATYPISADLSKHPTKIGSGDSVSFDIIIVARPVDDTTPTSWNSLRRSIYRTAKETRRRLETGDQELSRGDIGVVEMGECYREYSKHHGKVTRGGETMTAKEVVDEIYGIIQEASEIGTTDVFIDLLDTDDPTYDDVNKLCRGTNATPEELKKLKLYTQDDGFQVGTWDNEKRQAYIQERINGDSDSHLTAIDKLQFLRYRYEKGQSVQNYVEKWGVDDELRELAGRLADVTGDDTYTRVLGDRDITSY